MPSDIQEFVWIGSTSVEAAGEEIHRESHIKADT